jgi:urease gamma subunit
MVTKDYNLAVIESGKMMASTIIDLLMDDGKKAKEVLENFTPILSKKEYLELLRELSSEVFYESSHNIT